MSPQKVHNWAQTSINTDICLWYKGHSDLDSLTRPILFIGGVHGDEPEGVELAQKTLEWLLKNDSRVEQHWVLIECINPDGYKNKTRVNANGVDLNRNFPSSNWSPDYKEKRYYPGSKPSSEAEVSALVKLITQINPRIIFHAHSWNPCIVCTGEPGLPEANLLSNSSGYSVVNTIGYDTPGSLSQYGWFDNNIPIICIEEQEHIDLKLVWPHFESAIENIFTRRIQL